MKIPNFIDYKGVRSTLPTEGQRCFTVTICFFKPAGKSESFLKETLTADRKGGLIRWLINFDTELCDIIESARADIKNCKIRLYSGDPEEELEETMVSWSPPPEWDWEGYLVINRSAVLGVNDNPQSDEECDHLAGEFEPTEKVQRLFQHLERAYLYCDQLL